MRRSLISASRSIRASRSRTALAWIAAAGAAAVVLSACTSSSPSVAPELSSGVASATSSSTPSPGVPSSAVPSTPRTSAKPTPLGRPVRVSSVQGDGQVYGVGMPIIIRFGVSPTDKKAFEAAAKVTVNGAPARGAWFWEKPYADSPTEVHYRLPAYWPARSKIHVDLPVNRLSAGRGLSFANSLTLDYSTGAYHYSRVDASALRMTVYSDGKVVRTIPVSLGKGSTPTYTGTKVVMEKNRNERMVGPGYDEIVPWSVRITNSGEFIHAAPWNSRIGQTSTSNGCTNLSVADATWFFNFSVIGDVVQYPNASGQVMPSWDGYGDWNLPWATWQAGGKL